VSARTRDLIAAAAEQATARARSEGRAQWAAVRIPRLRRDALLALSRDTDRFYWERPSEDVALATAGCVHEVVAQGGQRFAECATEAEDVFRRVHVHGEAAPPSAGPVLVGGFGFGDDLPVGDRWRGFPAARLVLPARSLSNTPEGAFLTVLHRAPPGSEPQEVAVELEAGLEVEATHQSPPEFGLEVPRYGLHSDRPLAAYRNLVSRALDDIAAGELEKVVVARSVRIENEVTFEPARLLDALRRRHPSCASFAVGRDDATYLGATPETLLRLSGRRLETAALAGSALRGRTPEADAALARDLIESKKEQAEHSIVVRAIRDALMPHCDDLVVPESPTLLALESIQHLETRIAGTLISGQHLLEVAAALHPTPAVGGAPREAALAWLREHESLERGWYAGAVGYVDAAGGGDLAVALRSALLRGEEADLFAGAGIVAGSNPDAELAETRLKLRPLLTLLLEL
jgi:isochorismate synthase